MARFDMHFGERIHGLNLLCGARLTDEQAGTNYILPIHELSCTQRCLQCTIMPTKIVYSCRHCALEQKCLQKDLFARLYTKYK